MSDPQTQEPAPAPEIPAPAPEPPAPAPAPPPPAPATAEDDETYCRVCYGEDNESDNRLFAPCSCTGGAQLIHLRCLEEWIEKRPSRNETEPNRCEVCQQPYRITLRHTFSCRQAACLSSDSVAACCEIWMLVFAIILVCVCYIVMGVGMNGLEQLNRDGNAMYTVLGLILFATGTAFVVSLLPKVTRRWGTAMSLIKIGEQRNPFEPLPSAQELQERGAAAQTPEERIAKALVQFSFLTVLFCLAAILIINAVLFTVYNGVQCQSGTPSMISFFFLGSALINASIMVLFSLVKHTTPSRHEQQQHHAAPRELCLWVWSLVALSVFAFVWFVFGNVWVLGSLAEGCSDRFHAAYSAAVGILVLEWVLCVLGMCYLLVFCCAACVSVRPAAQPDAAAATQEQAAEVPAP